MKCKCKFYVIDLFDVIELIESAIKEIQIKKVHELSELLILRLHVMQALCKKFKSKTYLMPPGESVTFTFLLPEIIALKHCMMGNQKPGVVRIYMILDKKLHPAIQLEL